MTELESQIPKLLGEAVFASQVFNGIWEFHYPSGGQEDYMHYSEEFDKKDKRDKSKTLLNWLYKNSIEKTNDGFVFQGNNGAKCSFGRPEIKGLTREHDSPPVKGITAHGTEYKLPFKTKCTYCSTVRIRWQPEKLGIPDELRTVLESMGYTEQSSE